jgi:hypothetical protein
MPLGSCGAWFELHKEEVMYLFLHVDTRFLGKSLTNTIPQPIYSVLRRVGISHYSDLRSLGIDLYRLTPCVADSGVAINLYRLTYLYRPTIRRYWVDIPTHSLTSIVNLYRPMVCLYIFIATDCLILSI